AVGKQITIFKDTDNKLNFKILEPGGQYIQVRTDNTPDWEPAGGWKLIVCVYHYNTSTNIWTLKIFIDGLQQTITSTGSASTSNLPGSLMYIGASSIQTNFSNSIFDDFFIYDVELTDVEISQIFDSNIQMSEGILRATTGHSTTASTIGDETTVAHSLGEIPSFIEITEKGPGIVYLSGDSTNQYFYVKSTGSSINFNWRAWK
ncbi:MAG: LamG domain-containing protein, partial [Firmicutes bacterium]|nr:LamG domain-containing protein [Bacillota bacterium]